MGGGGDTTNVTNTGLGDDQYQTLADNQVGISGQITDSYADATKRYNQFDRRFGNLDSSVSGLSTSMLDQFKNSNKAMNTNFTNMGNNMGGRFNSLDTSVGANNQGIGNLQSSVEGVGSDVTAGFADTQTRFDTVDTANQNIQDDVTTGFTDQAQAFSDVQGAMADNTGNIRDDITSNFQTTNDALASSEQNIRDDVETSQANVLGGQGGLASDLSDLSNTNDVYFDTLATNQGNLQTGQEGFQTSFDNYVDRYSDDTTLANQTRADLQQAQATGFDATRQSIGMMGNTVSEGQQQLVNTFMNESGQIDTALINQARDLANVASTQTDLDMGLRQNFQQISTAFNGQGQLIPNSLDGNGNTILRQMDDNGNLMLRAMDPRGRDVGSKVINLNDSVRQLRGLTIQSGGNGQMGQLSPANSGFTSPFTTTQ
tara:strand:+ start:626 stop:1912 length:1287 start_codon:yes stop_codon:yes gene_type:complete